MKTLLRTNTRKAKMILFLVVCSIIYFCWFTNPNLNTFEGSLYLYFIVWLIYNFYNLSKRSVYGDIDYSVEEIINSLSINFIVGIIYLAYFVIIIYILCCIYTIFKDIGFEINFSYLFFSVIVLFCLTKFEKLILRKLVDQHKLK